MRADIYPLQVFLLSVGAWLNRHQQRAIEYLLEENRVLKEQLKGRRLRLTDGQRRRLAAKGKVLGRRATHKWLGTSQNVASNVFRQPNTVAVSWAIDSLGRRWTKNQ